MSLCIPMVETFKINDRVPRKIVDLVAQVRTLAGLPGARSLTGGSDRAWSAGAQAMLEWIVRNDVAIKIAKNSEDFRSLWDVAKSTARLALTDTVGEEEDQPAKEEETAEVAKKAEKAEKKAKDTAKGS